MSPADVMQEQRQSRWRVDPGTTLAVAVLAVSFVTSYAVLSVKVQQAIEASVEEKAEVHSLAEAIRSLEKAVVRLETQAELRGKP